MKRIKNRNKLGVFMRISGFIDHEIDDIIYRQKVVKEVQRQKRLNRRIEHKLLNYIREAHRLIPTGKKKEPRWLRKQRQIENGFRLAEKWRNRNDK